MIQFQPVPKPYGFIKRVQERGNQWLRENPNANRPRDLWSPYKSHLAKGFNDLCAYSAMYEPVGTVDHFVSWNEDKSKAYDWSNFRYASGWINSSKQSIPASQIFDPFEVENGWFEIILPSLQLIVSDTIPDELRARAEFVLDRFHLRDDERVLRQRRAWYDLYESGELTLEGLKRKAPLIAMAVEKPERLLEQVYQAVANPSGGATKSDILATIELSESQYKRNIATLLAQQRIRKTGISRGTRYFPMEPGAQAEEDEA